MAWMPRRSLFVLICVTLVLRLCWAWAIEMANDEAYHFLYTVHPDWSYFDHPPMLMWVASLGRWLCGGWLHPLSLRLGFVLLFAGSTWIMFDWTAHWFGERAGFYAALAMNVAAYFSAGAGTFVLPDGPFLFFALLTMRNLTEALFTKVDGVAVLRVEVKSPVRSDVIAWVWVGFACAGALTSKYHGALLPIATLCYVIVTPRAWPVLKTPGPYLAAILGSCGLIPIFVWNAQHEWASLAFQGARAVGVQFSPVGLATMIFGPIAFLLPWVWVPAIGALFTRIRRFQELTGVDRFLVCLSIVPLALFFCVSCVRPILPHWPLVGFYPLFPLVGALWARNAELNPNQVRRWVIFMCLCTPAIALIFGCQARFGLFSFPWKSDPAREISGWESVGRELETRGLLERPNTFLFTEHWYDSGQLAFCVRNRLPVTCYNQGDARGFAYWSKPQDWVGKDGLLVCTEDLPNLERFKPYFEHVELLASFSMTRGRKPFRPIHVYLCEDQQQPFPFVYRRRSQNTAR
jgi:4-amino-4-deoxy-L-arabinose transferase-like glycosyltransferase